MEAVFKICSKGTCGIEITGLERDGNQYKAEDNNILSIRTYKYTESITLNVIMSVSYDGTLTIEAIEPVTHVLEGIDNVMFNYNKDGIHKIVHIILPTLKLLNDTSLYTDFIYYDEATDLIKMNNEEITVELLLEIEPADDNTIIRADKLTFCICFLNECYYRICKDLLTKFCGKCINKLQKDLQEVYNRDIVWMTISVIKYLIEFGLYNEALRILEAITQCGNICGNLKSKDNNSCGCS